MNQESIQQLLSQYGIHPTKKRGQNFLLDESFLDEMLQAGSVDNKDIVVEVGPGLGVLTTKLAEQAKKVITIELDNKIIDFLQNEFLPEHKNVELIEGDALSSSTFHQLVAKLASEQIDGVVADPNDETYGELLDSLNSSYKVIANLPYQITSKLMRQFLEAIPRPSQLVVMVQKEVAERIIAKPGQMSLLSLSVQCYSAPRIVTKVPAKAYYPQPEVDSAILHCDVNKGNQAYMNLNKQEQKLFWRLAKAGFASKRKQLKNNLESVIKGGDILSVLGEIGLSPSARAQELSVDDWCRLVNVVGNSG